MPIYDFRCSKCGLEFEVSRPRDKAGDPVQCPQDGAEAVRIFSSLGFVMKGGSESIAPSSPPPAAHDHSHGHGHTHGPGTHTH